MHRRQRRSVPAAARPDSPSELRDGGAGRDIRAVAAGRRRRRGRLKRRQRGRRGHRVGDALDVLTASAPRLGDAEDDDDAAAPPRRSSEVKEEEEYALVVDCEGWEAMGRRKEKDEGQQEECGEVGRGVGRGKE